VSQTAQQWAAHLPEGWELAPAKAVFSERREPGHKDDTHLTPSQIYGVLAQSQYMEITGNKVVLNLAGQDNMRHVEPNDFIIHLRSFQGGIEWSGISGKVSPAYTVLVPRGIALPEYYRWVLKSEGYIQELAATTEQLRDGQSMTYKTFAKVRLPLPPLSEQQAIADYLGRETAEIDTLIAAQKRFIGLLQERRYATVASALEKYQDTPVRLKYLASIQSGVTLSGEGDPDDPEWPYLRVANVQTGYVDLGHVKTIRLPRSDAQKAMLRTGDVLMTEGGDIDKLGRGALWNGEISEVLHQNHIFSVRTGARLDPRFLVYCLDGPTARNYFRVTAKKTTNLASTNKGTVGNFPVGLPSLDEQHRVTAYLDEETAKIDTLIAKVQRHIELAKERRSALITAAVTGQVNVEKAV
jgi:type I restriction enzyme S subunit